MSEAAAGKPAAPSGAAAGGARGRGADNRLAAAVFAGLVVACFAAMIVTQRLKHTPTPVEEFKRTLTFTPGESGSTHPSGEERISFKLTNADHVTVTVEDSSGDTVATLLSAVPVGRYKILSVRWNGRRGVARSHSLIRRADGYTTLVPHNRGPLAPPGEYKVRVQLLAQKRSIPSPQSFQLVRP